jgi:CheY-like chemotaxis protein
LAEDDPVNQKLAVHLLGKLGCEVDVATDGWEALELWGKCPYDVIFMDSQMPGLDGYQTTSRIRASGDAGARSNYRDDSEFDGRRPKAVSGGGDVGAYQQTAEAARSGAGAAGGGEKTGVENTGVRRDAFRFSSLHRRPR